MITLLRTAAVIAVIAFLAVVAVWALLTEVQ